MTALCLAGADVSFALGRALPLAQSKADFVFMASNLKPLVATILLSKQTMQIVSQNLVWAAVTTFLHAFGHVGLFAGVVGRLRRNNFRFLGVLDAMRLSKTIQFETQRLMDILYLLVPLSVALVFFILAWPLVGREPAVSLKTLKQKARPILRSDLTIARQCG
jgi:cation transport ATPase